MPRQPYGDYKIRRPSGHLVWIKSFQVNTLDFAWHLLNFLAPALGVAALVTAAGPLVCRRSSASIGWWGLLAFNFIAGSVVLAAGLWWFGRDGKMATYAALVVAVATCHWLGARAWR